MLFFAKALNLHPIQMRSDKQPNVGNCYTLQSEAEKYYVLDYLVIPCSIFDIPDGIMNIEQGILNYEFLA